MERLIETAAMCSALVVPLLAMWAIACLYTLRAASLAWATQLIYFLVLLAVAALTVRTMMANDGCWLIHTSTLGVMIVSGVMRRPSDNELWETHSAL
jgi:hypothetical protein